MADDIVKRLYDACNGHPHANIAWPHRLLRDAVKEIETLRANTRKVSESTPRAGFAEPVREALAKAYEAGAEAVHNEWMKALDEDSGFPPCEADFSEAAHDYAALADPAQPETGVREALRDAFNALATLPVDVLGMANDDNGQWPIRDELMQKIDHTLSTDEAEPRMVSISQKDFATQSDDWLNGFEAGVAAATNAVDNLPTITKEQGLKMRTGQPLPTPPRDGGVEKKSIATKQATDPEVNPATEFDTIELYREIQQRQRVVASPIDGESDDDFESRQQARYALDDEWTGSLYYKGNSVGWSHSKSVKYGSELGLAWNALTAIGVPCDGSTTVADAIKTFCCLKEHSVSESEKR